MIENLRLALARWFGGLAPAPDPAPLPPPTDETRREILRIQGAYNDAQLLIIRRWANIRSYENGGAILLLSILLLLLSTLIKDTPVGFPTALIVAVFALVVGAGGALTQALVTHVVSLEGATEDLSRQLALAAGASDDAQALAASAGADRILSGRLRWAMQTADDALTVGGPPMGRRWRWSRIGFGVLLEGTGAVVIGFYAAVAIQGIREGTMAEVLSACIVPFLVAPVFLLLGHSMRTSDRRYVAALAAFNAAAKTTAPGRRSALGPVPSPDIRN
jgi:hypothetical protein